MHPSAWLLVILYWCWFPMAHACDRPLKVLATHWPPYVVEQIQPGGISRFSGTDVALLTEVPVAAGCQARFVSMPAERAHKALARGELDILMAASYVSDRLAYARFSAPYRQEVIAVLGHVDAAPLTSWQQLLDQRHTLLAPRHGFYGDSYARVRGELINAGVLSFYSSYDSAAAMLKAGRVDLVLGDVSALVSAAQNMRMKLKLLLIAHDAPVYFMFSRASVSVEVISRIDTALLKVTDPVGVPPVPDLPPCGANPARSCRTAPPAST